MRDDRPSIDEVSELLNRCLARISARLGRFSDGEPPEGLETVAEALDEDADRLEDLLSRLGDCVGETVAGRDVAAVVEQAADRVLSSSQAPLVLRTEIPEGLPGIAVGTEALEAALHRAIVLAAAHASRGGEVSIRLRAEPGSLAFELAAIPGSEGAAAVDRDRSATLEQFVEEFGGRCAAVLEDQVLRMALRFDVLVEPA